MPQRIGGKIAVLAGALLFAGAPFAQSQQRPEADGWDGAGLTVLRFNRMVGNSGPFIGAQNPIRGVNAGGAPWTISGARGKVLTNGAVKVQVRHLVLTDTGDNPVAMFKAIVSCLTPDDSGGVTATNVSTALFPATPTGDSDIDDIVDLPNTCFAPIVFVTSPGGSWFAVTGY